MSNQSNVFGRAYEYICIETLNEEINKLREKDEDYAQKLNVSSATIKRKIAELKAEGKIVRKGSNKKGFWEIDS